VKRAASGIVLAGGASSRMGRDKASLSVGGLPALERAAGTVARVCEEVVIAAGDHSPLRLSAVATVWVSDPPGMGGPLAGLAAGLGAARHDLAIVVACDMPFLSDRLLSHLRDIAEGCDAVVPLINGTPQSLHAAYARDCLPAVESLLRLGATSLRELLPCLRVKYLSESRCRALDPSGLSWFNMNTPGDYRFAALRGTRYVAA
jgi:molybdopterin-guanine dinucleotide biosynthesis protein A